MTDQTPRLKPGSINKHRCWWREQTIDDWLECLNKLLFIIEAEINSFKLTLIFQDKKGQVNLAKNDRPILVKNFVRFLHLSFSDRLPYVLTPPPIVNPGENLSTNQLHNLSNLVQEILVILYRASLLPHLADEKLTLPDILAAVPDMPEFDSSLINKVINDYKLAIDNQLVSHDNVPSSLVDTTTFRVRLFPHEPTETSLDQPIVTQDNQNNPVLDLPPLSSQDFKHLVKLSQSLSQATSNILLIEGIGLDHRPSTPDEVELVKLVNRLSRQSVVTGLSEVIAAGYHQVDSDFVAGRIAENVIDQLVWRLKRDGLNKLSDRKWLTLRSAFRKHPEDLSIKLQQTNKKIIRGDITVDGQIPRQSTTTQKHRSPAIQIIAKSARIARAAPNTPNEVKDIVKRSVFSQIIQSTSGVRLDKKELQAVERVAEKAANYLVYLDKTDTALNLVPKQVGMELISQEPGLDQVVAPEVIQSAVNLVGSTYQEAINLITPPLIKSGASLSLAEQIALRHTITTHYQKIINQGIDPTALYLALTQTPQTLQNHLTWLERGSPINIFGFSIPTSPKPKDDETAYKRYKSLVGQVLKLDGQGLLKEDKLSLIIRWLRFKNRIKQSYEDRVAAVKQVAPHATTIMVDKVKERVKDWGLVKSITDRYHHSIIGKIFSGTDEVASSPEKKLTKKIRFAFTNPDGWFIKEIIKPKLEKSPDSLVRLFDLSQQPKERLRFIFGDQAGWFKVKIVHPSLKKRGDKSVFAYAKRFKGWSTERWQNFKKSRFYKRAQATKKKLAMWNKKYKKYKGKISRVLDKINKYIEILSPKNLVKKAVIALMKRLGQLAVKTLSKIGIEVTLSSTGIGTVIAAAMVIADIAGIFRRHWQEILATLFGLLWYIMTNLASFIGGMIGAGIASVIAPFFGPIAPAVGFYLGWQVGGAVGNWLSALKSFFKGVGNWLSNLGSGSTVSAGAVVATSTGLVIGTTLIMTTSIIPPAFMRPGEYQNTPGSRFIKVYKTANVPINYKKLNTPAYPVQLINQAADLGIEISYKVIVAAVDRPITLNKINDIITIYTKDGDKIKQSQQSIQLTPTIGGEVTNINITPETPVEFVGVFKLKPEYKNSRLINQVVVNGLVDDNQESKSDVFEILIGDAPKTSCTQLAVQSQSLTNSLYKCEAGAAPSQVPGCYCPTSNSRGYYVDTFHCGQKPDIANYLHSSDPDIENIEANYVQCTEFVHQAFDDVFQQSTNAICSKGTPGGFLGHAGQWLSRASQFCPDQFEVIYNDGRSDPQPGDILVFAGGRDEYGHVAIVSLDGSDPDGNFIEFCGANTTEKCYKISRGQKWNSPFLTLKLIGWLRYKFCQS